MHGFGVGQANVFPRHADDAPRQIARVCAAIQHAGEPVQGRIGVRTAHGFVQRGYLVVEVVAAFVKPPRLLAQRLLHKSRVHIRPACGLRGHMHLLQRIEQPPRVAICQGGQCLQRIVCHAHIRQGLQGALCQLCQLRIRQGLQHIHLRPREQGRIDLERRVLGCGAHKHHQPRFDKRQQGVLLAFVEAVNLVNKQDGAAPLRSVALRLLHGRADVFHTAEHG